MLKKTCSGDIRSHTVHGATVAPSNGSNHSNRGYLLEPRPAAILVRRCLEVPGRHKIQFYFYIIEPHIHVLTTSCNSSVSGQYHSGT
jgi:hypothetical protein